MNKPVYSTSTEQANLRRTGRAGMLKVAAAPLYICHCGHVSSTEAGQAHNCGMQEA